jgi:opacity protein-like surface antigen
MQTRWMQRAFLLVGAAALASAAACAQTDIAASVYGAFNGTTTANGVSQSPSNSAGALLEVRHISKPWFGFEGTYAFNHATQTYSEIAACPGTNCPISAVSAVSANAHELTADYVASVKIKLTGFRPFALVGGGLLLDVPGGSQVAVCDPISNVCVSGSTSTSTKPVFVYGGGLDWGLLPHIGLRLQYRGNLYKAPDLTNLFTSTSAFTHTAQPMIGIYFRL